MLKRSTGLAGKPATTTCDSKLKHATTAPPLRIRLGVLSFCDQVVRPIYPGSFSVL